MGATRKPAAKSPDWPKKLRFFHHMQEIANARASAARKLPERLNEIGEQAGESALATYIYLDFVGHLWSMRDALLKIADPPSSEIRRLKTEQRKRFQKALDLTLEDAIVNTEPLDGLREVFHALSRRKGSLSSCLELDKVDTAPSFSVSWELGFRGWTRYLNLSDTSALGRLAGSITSEYRRFSERTLMRLAQTLLFRSVITHLLGREMEIFPYGERFEGLSLLPQYFEAFLNLPGKLGTQGYLLRTSSLELTWVSAINDFGFALEDIHRGTRTDVCGLLFVPGYPNPDTLKAELFWQDQRRIDITVLYLLDLYELIRIWSNEGCLEYLTRRAHE